MSVLRLDICFGCSIVHTLLFGCGVHSVLSNFLSILVLDCIDFCYSPPYLLCSNTTIKLLIENCYKPVQNVGTLRCMTRIPMFCSVFVMYLKLISNLFSVHLRTC